MLSVVVVGFRLFFHDVFICVVPMCLRMCVPYAFFLCGFPMRFSYVFYPMRFLFPYGVLLCYVPMVFKCVFLCV